MMTPPGFGAQEAPKPKSEIQRSIDGEYGPAMIGVTTYPYSRSQRQYIMDFRALVAGTITHPYMSTASHGTPSTSVPHDLLAGEFPRVCYPYETLQPISLSSAGSLTLYRLQLR